LVWISTAHFGPLTALIPVLLAIPCIICAVMVWRQRPLKYSYLTLF
jgi:hypothetical protein